MMVNPDMRAAVGLSSDFDDRNLDPSGNNVAFPQPVTLDPTPYTLIPKPETLTPNP